MDTRNALSIPFISVPNTRSVLESCYGGHGVALEFYQHAGRIPETYQKDIGREQQMRNPQKGFNFVSHMNSTSPMGVGPRQAASVDGAGCGTGRAGRPAS